MVAMTVNLPTTVTDRQGEAYIVRPLTRADAAALQRFNAELSDASRERFPPHAYDDETVKRALDRAEQGEDLLLGLFKEDRIAGYFFLWYFTRPVPLLGIGLLDECQGRGLGRQMMQILIDAARHAGCDGIELTTRMHNEAAFVLYQKLGFVHYSDTETLDGNGERLTERAMYYELRPGGARFEGSHVPPV